MNEDDGKLSPEDEATISNICDREGFEQELLYEMAFSKARELDGYGPPVNLFDAGTEVAASVVLGMAFREDMDKYETSALRDIYDALTGSGPYRLQLTGSKRGRRLTGEQLLAQSNSDLATTRLVEFLTKKMGKREAAVAAIVEVMGGSRAAVFASMRRARRLNTEMAELRAKRALLAKSRNNPE